MIAGIPALKFFRYLVSSKTVLTMKQALVFTFFLFLTVPTRAQYFSGEVEYRTRIVPKVEGLNIDSILNLRASSHMVYKITDGFYKSGYYKDDKEVYSYTYHGNTKRMFDEYIDRDYITFRDSRKANNVRIRSIIYRDSTKTVVGYPCFMAERVYENYISKTYYARNLKINVESFKDHATGDWYNQIKDVDGSLSLGSVNEYAKHYEISEVIRVTPRKLSAEDFALPAGKLVVASSSALEKQPELSQPSNESVRCYQEKMTAALVEVSSIDEVSYVSFIVTRTGEVNHVEPYEEDARGLFKTAVDVIMNCGLKFLPGELEGKPADSWVYFPVQFKK